MMEPRRPPNGSPDGLLKTGLKILQDHEGPRGSRVTHPYHGCLRRANSPIGACRDATSIYSASFLLVKHPRQDRLSLEELREGFEVILDDGDRSPVLAAPFRCSSRLPLERSHGPLNGPEYPNGHKPWGCSPSHATTPRTF